MTKLNDASRFTKSAKALFSICTSRERASRAAEKVYALSHRCDDPTLLWKLVHLSDALTEQRGLLHYSALILTDPENPEYLHRSITHSRKVFSHLREAEVL